MTAIYNSRSFGADKRRAWEAVVSQLYASMDVRVRGTPEFEGEIAHCLLDDLDLTHVIADYEIASRTRGHIARDVRQSCVFLNDRPLRCGKERRLASFTTFRRVRLWHRPGRLG